MNRKASVTCLTLLFGISVATAQNAALRHPSGLLLGGREWSAAGPVVLSLPLASAAGEQTLALQWPEGAKPGPLPAALRCAVEGGEFIQRVKPVVTPEGLTATVTVPGQVSGCTLDISVLAASPEPATVTFDWQVTPTAGAVTRGRMVTRTFTPPAYALTQRWLDAQGFPVSVVAVGEPVYLESVLTKQSGKQEENRLKVSYTLPDGLQVDPVVHPANRSGGFSVQPAGCVVVYPGGKSLDTHLGKSVCRTTRVGLVAAQPGEWTVQAAGPAKTWLFDKVTGAPLSPLKVVPSLNRCLSVSEVGPLDVPAQATWSRQLSVTNPGDVAVWSVDWQAQHDRTSGYSFQFGSVPPEPSLQEAWDRFLAARAGVAPGERVTLTVFGPASEAGGVTERLSGKVVGGCDVGTSLTINVR